MLLGRRAPAFLPASSATPNIVSESGAIDRPVCSALYSSTICRKIGIAIIEPPSAICCSICPVIRAGTTSTGTGQDRSAPVSHHAFGGRASKRTIPSRLRQPPRAPRRTPRLPARRGCPGRVRPCRRRTGARRRRRCAEVPCTAHLEPDRYLKDDRDDHDLQRKPTRHDRKVVMKPPSKGPTAAAIAAEAPTMA